MIDNFALAVSHGLMMLAAVLLMRRRDLDAEAPAPPLHVPSPPALPGPRGERPRA